MKTPSQHFVSGFMPTTYQSNYIPHTSQTPQSQELVSVYPQQPMQVVYPQTPQPHNQQTPLMYTTPPPVLYTQNPLYSNPTAAAIYQQTAALPPQSIAHYPQNPSTPNSCSSSVSNNAYCRQLSEIAPLQPTGGAVSSFNR